MEFQIGEGFSGVADWVPILLSPFIGSFLGVLATRLPTGESVVWGRSKCPHCEQKLRAYELIPIFSWLATRGRCARCGEGIAPLYLATEIGALGIALWAATETSGWLLWLSCILGWLLLVLALVDFTHLFLPDSLNLTLLALGLLSVGMFDADDIADHIYGALAGYFFIVAVAWLYRRLRKRDGIGMGDAKLFSVAGAWLTWTALPSVLWLAALSGLIVVAVRAAIRVHAPSDRIPFGPCLALGIWIVWLYGPLSAALE